MLISSCMIISKKEAFTLYCLENTKLKEKGVFGGTRTQKNKGIKALTELALHCVSCAYENNPISSHNWTLIHLLCKFKVLKVLSAIFVQ